MVQITIIIKLYIRVIVYLGDFLIFMKYLDKVIMSRDTVIFLLKAPYFCDKYK